MLIRPFESKDLQRIKDIIGLYWDGELRDRFVKRLDDFAAPTPEIVAQQYSCFVAEQEGEVTGFLVMRKTPEHMVQYTRTANPAELYLMAAAYKGQGVGKALKEKAIEEAQAKGFTEVVLYSAESHKDSWNFYDNSGFKRISPATAPNGEAGYIWGMKLG